MTQLISIFQVRLLDDEQIMIEPLYIIFYVLLFKLKTHFNGIEINTKRFAVKGR